VAFVEVNKAAGNHDINEDTEGLTNTGANDTGIGENTSGVGKVNDTNSFESGNGEEAENVSYSDQDMNAILGYYSNFAFLPNIYHNTDTHKLT
jgi:hypothetical protein